MPFPRPKTEWIPYGVASLLTLPFLIFLILLDAPDRIFLAALLGIPLIVCLARYPEVALAVYLMIGMIKGDPRLSFMESLDLTLVFAGLLVAFLLAEVIYEKRRPPWPKEFLLYLPPVFMMLISLVYTPHFEIGVAKAGRFILLTGLAIVSPLYFLGSSTKMMRFLTTLVGIGLLISVQSFTMLGGSERLVAPSGLNIQLGYIAAISIILVVYLFLVDSSVYQRLLSYLLLAIFSIGLIGAGARSATIGASVCMILCAVFYKRLIRDLLVFGGIVVLILWLVPIPEASYEYLGTLTRSNPHDVLTFRNDLMQLGVDLTSEYPFLGVGIGGYPFHSPDPNLYNWPHHVILEFSAETGDVSALAVSGIILAAFWETLRQLRQKHWNHRRISCAILALLVIGVITLSNTGDMNEIRSIWLFLSLPFVLRGLERTEKATTG